MFSQNPPGLNKKKRKLKNVRRLLNPCRCVDTKKCLRCVESVLQRTWFLFPNRSLLLKGSHFGQKNRCTETHTEREAASMVSRPGIATPMTQKHIKHYKTNAFLMISNFLYSTAQARITFLFQECVH